MANDSEGVYLEPIPTPLRRNYGTPFVRNGIRGGPPMSPTNKPPTKQAKTFWIVGSIIFLAFCTAGLLGSVVYLFTSMNEQRNQVNSRRTNCSGSSGVTIIYPQTNGGHKLLVYCDGTDGGGWMVFQRRQDGSVNFTRNWKDYVDGFGTLEGNYWMGLEKLHRMLKDGNYELRVDLEDWDGNRRYAKYSTFSIADSADNYRLHVRGYSGSAGDAMPYHDKQQFSTFDRDNDPDSRHCSQEYPGGWWFYICFTANLNGIYRYKSEATVANQHGIIWYGWRGENYSFKFAEMKIRRKKSE